MPPDLDAIEKRIARSYERGRLQRALGPALVVVIVAGAYCLTQGRHAMFWGIGGAAAVATALLLWRGLDLGRGVTPGLIAGVAGVAVLHCGLACGSGCAGACAAQCLRVCAGAGLLAGTGLALMLGARPRSSVTWITAVALAALLGLLGCPELAASHALAFGATLALATTLGGTSQRLRRA